MNHFIMRTERQVAEQLAVSIAAVRKWRLEDRGPRYYKVGACVRYRPEDVEAWLDARPSGGGPLGRKVA